MFRPIVIPGKGTKVAYIGLICPNCGDVMGLGERVIIANKESHICTTCGTHMSKLLDSEDALKDETQELQQCPHYGECSREGFAPEMCPFCSRD